MQDQIRLQKIFIEEESAEDAITRNVLDYVRIHNMDTEIYYIPDHAEFIRMNQDKYSYYDKNILLLHRYRGKFLSSCPGSEGVVCCMYHVLNIGIGCPFDCAYCFLQSYAKHPFMTAHTNVQDLLAELDRFLGSKPGFHYRIGTGEFIDSIALDPILGYNKILIDYFRKSSNATLELKTKSAEVDHLLQENPTNVVISWTLNPQKIVDEHEAGASSLEERLEAARVASMAGFQLGFHFDPIFYYEGWENDYEDIIQKISRMVDMEKIRWISLGVFRYSVGFREVLKIHKPKSTLTSGEMFLSEDYKYRFLSGIRVGVYKKMAEYLDKYLPGVYHYMCMETQNLWQRVYQTSRMTPVKVNSGFEKRRLGI